MINSIMMAMMMGGGDKKPSGVAPSQPAPSIIKPDSPVYVVGNRTCIDMSLIKKVLEL